MDRRKFLKVGSAALAGLVVGSCTEDRFYPDWRRPDGRRDDSRNEGRSTSLFVASDRHEMGEGNNLPKLLEVVAKKASTKPTVVYLGGDYVGGRGNMTPEFPISSLYEEVYSVFEPATCDAMFTYGSHDDCCTDGYNAFFSGPRRCNGYYIYGISYAQVACATEEAMDAATSLRNQILLRGASFDQYEDDDLLLMETGYGGIDIADRFGKSAESGSANFLKWADSLSDNMPIVVMSHMPLHVNRSDNKGGLIWFEALSKVAKQHPIIFLWGHNHTLEEKAKDITDREDKSLKDRFLYLVTPSDLLNPGDNISIQGDGDVVDKKLNFIYANAGYIKLGYGTVITFTDSKLSGSYDKVTFSRYAIDDVDPETEIGFTGKSNPYTITLNSQK